MTEFERTYQTVQGSRRMSVVAVVGLVCVGAARKWQTARSGTQRLRHTQTHIRRWPFAHFDWTDEQTDGQVAAQSHTTHTNTHTLEGSFRRRRRQNYADDEENENNAE